MSRGLVPRRPWPSAAAVGGRRDGVAVGPHALLLGAPLTDGFRPRRRAIGSAGERLVHTEEVTGSIPVSPTLSCIPGGLQVANRVQKSGPSRADPLGANWEEFGRSTSLGRSGMDLPGLSAARRPAWCGGLLAGHREGLLAAHRGETSSFCNDGGGGGGSGAVLPAGRSGSRTSSCWAPGSSWSARISGSSCEPGTGLSAACRLASVGAPANSLVSGMLVTFRR